MAVLVHGPVDVVPGADDFHVGFVDEPPVVHPVPAGTGRVDQQRREALHPPIYGDVIDFYPTFGQDLLEVAIDSPYLRYQRTASRITSGGNR